MKLIWREYEYAQTTESGSFSAEFAAGFVEPTEFETLYLQVDVPTAHIKDITQRIYDFLSAILGDPECQGPSSGK